MNTFNSLISYFDQENDQFSIFKGNPDSTGKERLYIIHGNITQIRSNNMDLLVWAVVFLVIAVVAGAFGFTGVASAAKTVSKVLFAIFLIIFLIIILFILFGIGATGI
jgi:uncharacterized membrane protein YtjA (UPF0391 family)